MRPACGGEIKGPCLTVVAAAVEKEGVGVFGGVGEDDEVACARGRVRRVGISGGDFRPAEGVGVEEPEAVVCDGVIVGVETTVDDEVFGVRAGVSGSCSVGVSRGGDEEGIGGCVF